MKKSGQIEMIGLVIIVMLIVIGGLLFVRFGLQSEEVKQETTIQTTQTYHLLNAMLKIELCPETALKKAIDACNENQNICNQEACQLLKTKIETILQETSYKKTAFYAYNNGIEVLKINDCAYGTASPPYFFKEENKEYEVVLKQCT